MTISCEIMNACSCRRCAVGLKQNEGKDSTLWLLVRAVAVPVYSLQGKEYRFASKDVGVRIGTLINSRVQYCAF